MPSRSRSTFNFSTTDEGVCVSGLHQSQSRGRAASACGLPVLADRALWDMLVARGR